MTQAAGQVDHAEHQFAVRSLGETELHAVMPLVLRCYGDKAEPLAWWQWRLFSHGRASSIICVAETPNEIIGMQPMSIYDYEFSGERLKAAVLTGAMVDPRHRRRGVFGSLVKSCANLAFQSHCQFLTTMPNERSYRAFCGMGWTDLGCRTLLARPIDFSRVVRAFTRSNLLGSAIARTPWLGHWGSSPRTPVAAGEISSVERFGEDSDGLADRVTEANKYLTVRRDCDWLNWRYRGNPLVDYHRLESRRPGDGGLLGISVATIGKRSGLNIGYIVELMGVSAEVRRQLICEAIQHLKSKGAAAVLTVLSAPSMIADLRWSGFYRVPRIIAPKQFRTVYFLKNTAQDLFGTIRTAGDHHQTLGDWDGI